MWCADVFAIMIAMNMSVSNMWLSSTCSGFGFPTLSCCFHFFIVMNDQERGLSFLISTSWLYGTGTVSSLLTTHINDAQSMLPAAWPLANFSSCRV
jgi:hypothetical protein